MYLSVFLCVELTMSEYVIIRNPIDTKLVGAMVVVVA